MNFQIKLLRRRITLIKNKAKLKRSPIKTKQGVYDEDTINHILEHDLDKIVTTKPKKGIIHHQSTILQKMSSN